MESTTATSTQALTEKLSHYLRLRNEITPLAGELRGQLQALREERAKLRRECDEMFAGMDKQIAEREQVLREIEFAARWPSPPPSAPDLRLATPADEVNEVGLQVYRFLNDHPNEWYGARDLKSEIPAAQGGTMSVMLNHWVKSGEVERRGGGPGVQYRVRVEEAVA